jgi:hypothetical protein
MLFNIIYYRLNIFKFVTILSFFKYDMHKFFYSYLHAGSNGYFEILIFEKKNFLGGFFKIYTDTGGGGLTKYRVFHYNRTF